MKQRELLQYSFWRQVERQGLPIEEWALLALHCRGFLAEQRPERALVVGVNACRHHRYDDLALLHPRGRPRQAGPHRRYHGVQVADGVLFPTPQDEETGRRMVRQILNAGLPSLNGMTARDDSPPMGLRFHGRWDRFRKARFGPRIPVRVLEPGVALLVKALPLIRVWTWLACAGHGAGNEPYICARDIHHFRWLRGVMRHLAPPELQRHWRWHEEAGSRSYCHRWTLGPAEDGPEAWADLHARNIEAARLLLDDDVLHRVHAARRAITARGELNDENIASLLRDQGV